MIRRHLFVLFFLFSAFPIYSLSWSPPVNLSGPTADAAADFSDVGMDSAGNAIAVWVELLGTSQIRASTLLAGATTWSAPVTISNPLVGSLSPSIAVDPAGNAVAVWGTIPGIQAATYTFATSTWSAIQVISVGALDEFPQVGVDSAGNAIAVWNSGVVQASRLPFGSMVWSAPQTISGPSGTSLPQIAVSSGGNAVAVWDELFMANNVVRANVYSFAMDAWLGVQTISGTPASSSDVAVDDSGNAVAVWQETFMGDQVIRSATYSFGGMMWSAAQTISDPIASQPHIAMSGSGDAVAVWTEEQAGPVYQVQAAFLPFGGAWTAQVPISDAQSPLPFPEVAVDDSGNATAVWIGTSMGLNVFAATATFGGDWTAPVDISGPGVSIFFPDVAMNGDGNATAIWTLDNGMGTFTQAASGFLSLTTLTNVQGRQDRNRFIRQEDLINVLTWTSTDSSIVRFRIYRGTNTNLIGETSATIFEDHQRPPNQITTYFITSIDAEGSESNPVSVTVLPR